MDYNNEDGFEGGVSGDDVSNNLASTGPNPTDECLVKRYKQIIRPEDLTRDLKVATLFASKISFGDEVNTLRRLGMSASKFSKYQSIGKDKRLRQHLKKLPKKAGYSFLYAMTRLTDDQWQQGIDQGIIHPGASRREIEAFRFGTVPEPKPARNRARYFAGVTAPKDATEEDKEQFCAELLSLCEKTGFELVRK